MKKETLVIALVAVGGIAFFLGRLSVSTKDGGSPPAQQAAAPQQPAAPTNPGQASNPEILTRKEVEEIVDKAVEVSKTNVATTPETSNSGGASAPVVGGPHAPVAEVSASNQLCA